jgi:hypothetical protein
MKKIPSLLSLLFLICYFSGCKKDEIPKVDYFQESSVHSDDQARFAAEIDAVVNDVNFALETTPGFTGKSPSSVGNVCDATIVADTVSNPRTITLNYNGTSCMLNRKRSGKIIISMPSTARWANAGAAVEVNFVNFKVTRQKDNKDLIFNNKLVITNISGGLLSELYTIPSVTQTIFSGDLDLTFDNGKEWSWKTARQRVYRQDNGIVITTTGLQPQGIVKNVADWGNNRYGTPFLTPILIPLISRQDCNFRIVQGKIEIILTDKLYATAQMGLNQSGSPATCPGSNNYYLELKWRDYNGLARIALLPY